ALGTQLIVKTKGHGTGLSPAGHRLREALRRAVQRMREPLAAAEGELRGELAQILSGAAARLRLAASHDPLLMEVAQELADTVELSVVGSEEAVARLRTGAADAAGFHGGSEAGDGTAAGLVELGFAVLPLFGREQGLMLAPGNPLEIRTLADLARAKARFVNRQPGSGTRTWFDRLLREAGLQPQAIRGYAAEEFTHQAVAAVVASGAADAGMGVRAAAERFGLAFVPLGRETYFVAGLRGEDRLRAIRDAAAARLPTLAGYSAAV
ncbi:MAG: LuxR family transcriptional regulator, partial [Enterovirga sp.]|nr:LuxR family transcriptional regulator [Enterovirga sp.]